MKVTYDKNDLKSVLEAIRDELGKPIFRDAVRMYGVICDFAPELSAEAGVLRKLSEKGMLSELERAADSRNQMDIDRTRMKIRYQLAKRMFISEEKTAFFVDALESLYELKEPLPPVPPSAPPKPPPTSTPTPTPMPKPPQKPTPTLILTPKPKPMPKPVLKKQSKLPVICAVYGLIMAVFIVPVVMNHVGWTLENGVLTISGKGPMRNYQSYSLILGGGWAINTPWWEKKDDIVFIVVKSGVTSIGDRAFLNCSNLTEVTIPDSVTSIGEHAFAGCYNLRSVSIPSESVIYYGNTFEEWTTVTRRESPKDRGDGNGTAQGDELRRIMVS